MEPTGILARQQGRRTSDAEVTMLTTFQKAVLATLAGSALLIAFVLAAKTPALGATTLGSIGGPAATTLAIAAGNGGIAPGVITTGDATVKVKPDIAILSVGATAQAATAAEAQALVAERIGKILAAAKTLGIADKDTKTAGYSIQPQYSYPRGGDVQQPPRIVGYQAMQMVSLTLRKVDDAGKALDALVRNEGATNASVRFALDDEKPTQAEARRLAIEDARAKADAMARTAGVKLGKVLSISDQSPAVPYRGLEKFAAAQPAPAADSQIPVGDLEIVIRVQVQFAIE
jgi:hypothetical protein